LVADAIANRLEQLQDCGSRRYRPVSIATASFGEEIMAGKDTFEEQINEVGRPSVKSRQIGVRVTEAEYAALEREAWRTGHKVGDWARDQLLERMKRAEDDRISAHVFTELIGLQMLLMGSFSTLVQGKTLTAEQYQELIRNVQSGKGKRARELLLQRTNQEGK
jgi:hypothetical protein